MPKEMLDHLHSGGIKLDDNNIANPLTELHTPWDVTKNPAIKFTRDNKIEKQLA
jgi:hypothetical protein